MNASWSRLSLINPIESHAYTGIPRFGLLSPYPPHRCGLSTFGVALSDGLSALGAQVGVVQVATGERSTASRVIGYLDNDSPASAAACAELLNQHDVAIIAHDYDSYGGPDGGDIVEIIAGLSIPSVVIAHTVLKAPTARQRMILEAIAAEAEQVVVMSRAARERLCVEYDVDPRKVATIPHGAPLPPKNSPSSRFGRPTMLTWGLLRPGKGVERVIGVMDSLRKIPGQPRYLIAGRTHPKVLANEGEAYREAIVAQAHRAGVADSVLVDGNFRGTAALSDLIQSSAVVVVPNDSTDEVTSGVLVGSLARGRPVVATAFPHAIELLETGAGIVVDHDDPDALASALHRMLTQPRLAGTMAAEARRLAPTLGWPVVAEAHLSLARRLLTERSAVV